MNKLTLLLNDKEIIAEIARDPEVQIKIKDAIIDGAIRRCAKTENSIACLISEQLRKEIFDNSRWFDRLNEKYTKIIKDKAIDSVLSFVRSENKALNEEVRRVINDTKAAILDKLKGIDIEKIVREETRRIFNERFK